MTTRKNTFLIKRSNVPGKVPSPGDLQLGELALNTADVILYASGTTANQILPIGWDRLSTLSGGTVNGDVTINGFVSATTYLNLPPFVGNYLPLSGGTVYGNTVFSSGLSANTLFVSGLTQTSGITSTGGIIFPEKTLINSYTATTSDYFLNVTGETIDITLLSAVGVDGKLLVIKNEGGGIVNVISQSGETIDDRTDVLLTKGNSVQLISDGVNWIIIGYNISSTQANTGVISFTGLTKVTNTTFYVAPVKGFIVDDTTNPVIPFLTYVEYSGGVHTDNYVNTDFETYVYITAGGTIGQQPTFLTEQQRRENIFLGKLGHPEKLSINLVFSQPDYIQSPLAQLRDMFVPINLINGGVVPSTNGANLKFNTSAAYLYGLGINFTNNTLTPNALYIPGTAPCTFQYRTQTGGTVTNITDIDPLNYDVGGVVTPIIGTKASNQRIYLLQNGSIRVQYGQNVYTTMSQAIEGIQTETFVPFPNFINNAVLIGILTVLSTATDLTDTAKARFFFASKFGETVGAAGGVSTTNLQQAYNNSSNPEIITNSIQNAVQFRSGTGNDNDKNIVIENNAGSQTAWITASGDSRFRSANLNYIDFNTGATVTQSQGRISWDSGTGTLNVAVGDVTTGLIDLQVGQEEIVRVYNDEATTLQKGEIVYVSGSQGNRPKVKRASATSDGYSVTTLGMVDLSITSGSEGYVTTFGVISDLNTLGLTGGTPIWLSPTTPGGYTSTKPIAPEHTVLIGYVVRVSATVGSIFVNISNGWELDEIHDVRISGATEGDLLIRSSYSGTPVWVNSKTLNGNYTISGNTNQNGNFNITGNTIVYGGLSADTITITQTPTLNNGLTQILGRNETTGEVGYRQINTIGNKYTYVSGATYSALTTDNVIGVDTSISATTIYLPNSIISGRLRYDIKDIGLNSFNNNITIISEGSDTIISTENSNNVVLGTDGGALIIFNTGTGIWLQM